MTSALAAYIRSINPFRVAPLVRNGSWGEDLSTEPASQDSYAAAIQAPSAEPTTKPQYTVKLYEESSSKTQQEINFGAYGITKSNTQTRQAQTWEAICESMQRKSKPCGNHGDLSTEYYQALIRTVESLGGDESLAIAQWTKESNLNPVAKGNAGELGIGQIKEIAIQDMVQPKNNFLLKYRNNPKTSRFIEALESQVGVKVDRYSFADLLAVKHEKLRADDKVSIQLEQDFKALLGSSRLWGPSYYEAVDALVAKKASGQLSQAQLGLIARVENYAGAKLERQGFANIAWQQMQAQEQEKLGLFYKLAKTIGCEHKRSFYPSDYQDFDTKFRAFVSNADNLVRHKDLMAEIEAYTGVHPATNPNLAMGRLKLKAIVTEEPKLHETRSKQAPMQAMLSVLYYKFQLSEAKHADGTVDTALQNYNGSKHKVSYARSIVEMDALLSLGEREKQLYLAGHDLSSGSYTLPFGDKVVKTMAK